MSAEFCQKIPTACQFFIHGIAFDRSSRSFDSIFGIRQYKYRTIVIFSHTSSHKAGKAFMIIDNNYYGSGTVYFNDAMPVARSAKMEAAATDTGASLEFQDMKINCSVNVRFVLE